MEQKSDDDASESSEETSDLWTLYKTVRNYTTNLGLCLAEPFLRLPNKRSVYPSAIGILHVVRHNRCCSAGGSAYSYTFLCSVVCLSVCRLSHLCSLLEPFNRVSCCLARTRMGSSDTVYLPGGSYVAWSNIVHVRWGSLTSRRRIDLASQNMRLRILCCHLANTNDEFVGLATVNSIQCFQPNYFCLCSL